MGHTQSAVGRTVVTCIQAAAVVLAASAVPVPAAAAPSPAPRSSPAPSPAPKAAPAPAPKPAPAPAPVQAPKPSPTPQKVVAVASTSAVPKPVTVPMQAVPAKPAATIAPRVEYQTVTVNAPAAVPKPATLVAAGQTEAVKVAAPVTTERPSGVPKRAAAVAATAAVAGVAAGMAVAKSGGKASSASVNMAGLDAGVQRRLEPQLSKFQANYRQVEIRREPTTSGWTWLFLTWALANSVENSHLEADKRAMQARVDELERKLRQEPTEWESLQQLSAASSIEKQEEGEEIGTPAQVEQGAPSAMAQSAVPQPTDGANDAFNALSDGLQKLLPIACVLMVGWIGFVISYKSGLH